jgi:hypothetical protein
MKEIVYKTSFLLHIYFIYVFVDLFFVLFLCLQFIVELTNVNILLTCTSTVAVVHCILLLCVYDNN